MIRLFYNGNLSTAPLIELDGGAFHYIKDVMRCGIGDSILLFDGKNGEWRGEIQSFAKKAFTVKIAEQTAEQGKPAPVSLYFSLLKKDKTDFVVEKATEMNVAAINPIITDRTVAVRTNTDRLKLIAIEAAEQCERTHLPTISEPIKFAELLSIINEKKDVFFMMDERGKGKRPVDVFPLYKGKSVSFIIGPEGGFSEKEFATVAKYDNVIGISLGKNILRAETAAVASLATWHTLGGDFI